MTTGCLETIKIARGSPTQTIEGDLRSTFECILLEGKLGSPAYSP